MSMVTRVLSRRDRLRRLFRVHSSEAFKQICIVCMKIEINSFKALVLIC